MYAGRGAETAGNNISSSSSLNHDRTDEMVDEKIGESFVLCEGRNWGRKRGTPLAEHGCPTYRGRYGRMFWFPSGVIAIGGLYSANWSVATAIPKSQVSHKESTYPFGPW
jgi:hypothetical protein